MQNIIGNKGKELIPVKELKNSASRHGKRAKYEIQVPLSDLRFKTNIEYVSGPNRSNNKNTEGP